MAVVKTFICDIDGIQIEGSSEYIMKELGIHKNLFYGIVYATGRNIKVWEKKIENQEEKKEKLEDDPVLEYLYIHLEKYGNTIMNGSYKEKEMKMYQEKLLRLGVSIEYEFKIIKEGREKDKFWVVRKKN